MYEGIKDNMWKIDIDKKEFLVEKLNNFSYISYNDYTNWKVLIDKIVKV